MKISIWTPKQNGNALEIMEVKTIGKKLKYATLKASNLARYRSLLGESTLRGAQIVVALYCFLKVPCLNFNHVIIMKDFHNVFTYYGRSKPK